MRTLQSNDFIDQSKCRARLTPVVTDEKQFLPSAEDIKTEALHKELDSLDTAQEQEAGGVAGLRDFLTKDKETDSSSSTPEEITASGPGAAGLKNLLEREARERSSSGESWEKVSLLSISSFVININ